MSQEGDAERLARNIVATIGHTLRYDYDARQHVRDILARELDARDAALASARQCELALAPLIAVYKEINNIEGDVDPGKVVLAFSLQHAQTEHDLATAHAEIARLHAFLKRIVDGDFGKGGPGYDLMFQLRAAARAILTTPQPDAKTPARYLIDPPGGSDLLQYWTDDLNTARQKLQAYPERSRLVDYGVATQPDAGAQPRACGEHFDAWLEELDEQVIQGEFGYERGEFTVFPDMWESLYDKGLTPRQAWQQAMDTHRYARIEEECLQAINYARIKHEDAAFAPSPSPEAAPPSASDVAQESKEATHRRFYEAFHSWLSSEDEWDGVDMDEAPEALATIAVEIYDERVRAARQAGERAGRDTDIRQFAKEILHGDEKHRQWLLDAAEDFIAGNPVRRQAPDTEK